MKQVTIKRQTFEAIAAQAQREYPCECCGFVIGDGAVEEMRPIENIQNRKHAADPVAFPRDARTAYLMDPRRQLEVLQEIDERHLQLRLVYHSHPDHDAYFSPTDRRQACSFDPAEPDFPDTAYLVMSIVNGEFKRAAFFTWNPERKDFTETAWSLN